MVTKIQQMRLKCTVPCEIVKKNSSAEKTKSVLLLCATQRYAFKQKFPEMQTRVGHYIALHIYLSIIWQICTWPSKTPSSRAILKYIQGGRCQHLSWIPMAVEIRVRPGPKQQNGHGLTGNRRIFGGNQCISSTTAISKARKILNL